MVDDDPQQLVDELAARLRRSVVVNDPGVRLLWASRHFGDEDPVRIRAVLQRDAGPEVAAHVLASGVAEWTSDGVVPARADLGLTARRCVPVRVGGELLAMLLVIDADATLTPEEVELLRRTAERIGGLLEAGAHRRRVARLEEEVGALLGTDPAARVPARRALEAAGAWDGAGSTRVAAVRLGRHDTDVPPLRVLRGASSPAPGVGTAPFVVADGTLALLLWCGPACPSDGAVEAAVSRWVTRLSGAAGAPREWVAGTGPAVPDPADAWRSARLARLAASGAGRPGRPQVLPHHDLGVDAVLLRLDPLDLDETAVPPGLLALREADARTGGHLVETLRTFLDRGGSAPRTAEDLFIHRTSLYYRLDRIAEHVGADLGDGRVRLELHLGLHVLDRLDAFRQSEERQG
ncbi:PucR family transcriptional regulator [Phycicoccus avicenniae]|uniref:PucR family transcriptional regulator n=1 Tax=Phycicoccus avicenniae TaxID=2828860 RepID=UPI003D29640A